MRVVSQQRQRWINAKTARYDRVVLEKDLFGAWSLIACWDALHSRRGGMRMPGSRHWIAKRRRQRGYVPMLPPPDPSA